MPFLVGVHSSLMPVGTLHVSCPELSWNAGFFFTFTFFQILQFIIIGRLKSNQLYVFSSSWLSLVLVRTMSSSETECLLESIYSWSWNHVSILSFSESASNAFGWSCNCWCWYKCGGESIWWCLSAASWCCKSLFNSPSVFLFLVTLNFGTKKIFRPYFRPRFSSKLKLKIAQSRVSHLGRVVQSWVKITQG